MGGVDPGLVVGGGRVTWGLGCEYVGVPGLNWFMKRAWLAADTSNGGLTC